MFWCLNSTEPSERPARRGIRRLAVLRLLVWLALQLGFEHGEVIRHDEPNLLLGPITGGIGILVGLALSLSDEP